MDSKTSKTILKIEKTRIPKESPTRQNCKMYGAGACSWTVLESANYRPRPLAPA
jgi:hypothetical protein